MRKAPKTASRDPRPRRGPLTSLRSLAIILAACTSTSEQIAESLHSEQSPTTTAPAPQPKPPTFISRIQKPALPPINTPLPPKLTLVEACEQLAASEKVQGQEIYYMLLDLFEATEEENWEWLQLEAIERCKQYGYNPHHFMPALLNAVWDGHTRIARFLNDYLNDHCLSEIDENPLKYNLDWAKIAEECKDYGQNPRDLCRARIAEEVGCYMDCFMTREYNDRNREECNKVIDYSPQAVCIEYKQTLARTQPNIKEMTKLCRLDLANQLNFDPDDLAVIVDVAR